MKKKKNTNHKCKKKKEEITPIEKNYKETHLLNENDFIGDIFVGFWILFHQYNIFKKIIIHSKS